MLGQLLLHEAFVSDEAKRLMWAPVTLPDGTANPQNYGLGWRIGQATQFFGEERPITVIHHGGTHTGGAAFLMLVPDYGVSVAVLANSGNARRGVAALSYELVRLAIAEGNSF
jgi:CubicO group peptidase (beta-lactamase class C family)